MFFVNLRQGQPDPGFFDVAKRVMDDGDVR